MNPQMALLMKEARKKKGLTQTELAKLMDVKNTTISNWENGVAEPDMDSFVAYCKICGADCCDMMTKVYGDPTEPMLDFKCTTAEMELIHKYREIDERGKRTVRRLLEFEHDATADAKNKEF